MKLLGFCLLVALCCWSAATSSRNSNSRQLQRRKLQEVYRQLTSVKQNLQHSNKLLNTPPKNIEDCCCLPALECFRANLNLQFKATEKNHIRFYKSLQNPLTKMGLDFCNSQSGNNSTCQDCHAHPKQSAQEFFNRLESLIQKAIDRLSDY